MGMAPVAHVLFSRCNIQHYFLYGGPDAWIVSLTQILRTPRGSIVIDLYSLTGAL